MDAQHALQLSKMKNSSREMREYAFKMEAVKKNLSPPVDKEKKLREACEGFESVFIQKMWEQMRATVPDSGLLKGREEKFWQGMYDQELAKTMTKAGGIGLADMMYEQLSINLRRAGKNTADAVHAGQASPWASELAPAPLIREAQSASGQAGQAAAQPSGTAPLYSELAPPAAPDVAAGAASEPSAETPNPAPQAAASAGESDTDPAIVAALLSLRGGIRTDGVPRGEIKSGAQPPLPPLQTQMPPAMPGDMPTPGAQAQSADARGLNFVSTLGRPVRRPASGKRTIMPRASDGPRLPAGRPVNRNLPFNAQETQRAQVRANLEGTPPFPQAAGAVQGAPLPHAGAGSLPGPAGGQNSAGVEALNAFAAQQKAAYAPGAPNAPENPLRKAGG